MTAYVRTSICSLVLLLSACADNHPPQANNVSSNPGFVVSLLFEHDGCEVFRFVDGGHYRYYVRCKPGDDVTAIEQHTQYCGKNCYRTVQEEIQTVTVR